MWTGILMPIVHVVLIILLFGWSENMSRFGNWGEHNHTLLLTRIAGLTNSRDIVLPSVAVTVLTTPAPCAMLSFKNRPARPGPGPTRRCWARPRRFSGGCGAVGRGPAVGLGASGRGP